MEMELELELQYVYFLLVDSDDTVEINNLYERLLGIFVPGIVYTEVNRNTIIISSSFTETQIISELREVLTMIGYAHTYKYHVLKLISS